MQGKDDCGVSSLAMICGVSYADALEALSITTHKPARKGLFLSQLQRAAKHLGVTLVKRRVTPLKRGARGVLDIRSEQFRHFVVLEHDYIVDPDGGSVWGYREYFHVHAAFKPMNLLGP